MYVRAEPLVRTPLQTTDTVYIVVVVSIVLVLYFLHAKLDYGMANNFSSRRSFELIFLPTGSYSSG